MLQETAFVGKKANEKNRSVSGADLLLRALENEKVEVIFGYPGGAVLSIYDKIYDSKIRHILPRHEQGGIHDMQEYQVSQVLSLLLQDQEPLMLSQELLTP